MKDSYLIRPIEKKDSPGVAALIRTVMPEFGASGLGFAIHDPEVSDMFTAYNRPRHCYFVVVKNDVVLGGGGVAPLTGEEDTICELRKMYFMPEIRGLGLGQKVMDLCLESARKFKFQKCYLETLRAMDKARALYIRNGFDQMSGPLGATGHFSCDSFFIKKL